MEESEIIENKIVVKYSWTLFIIPILALFALGFLGFLSMSVYFRERDVIFIWVALCLLGYFLGAGIWMFRRLYRPTIAVIDDNGVYWAKKKRHFKWDEIHSLQCELELFGIGRDKARIHTFWCFLNDGEQLKVNLERTNFISKELCSKICRQFPRVRCDFVDKS